MLWSNPTAASPTITQLLLQLNRLCRRHPNNLPRRRRPPFLRLFAAAAALLAVRLLQLPHIGFNSVAAMGWGGGMASERERGRARHDSGPRQARAVNIGLTRLLAHQRASSGRIEKGCKTKGVGCGGRQDWLDAGAGLVRCGSQDCLGLGCFTWRTLPPQQPVGHGVTSQPQRQQ